MKTKTFTIKTPNGDSFDIVVTGRTRWALERLLKAGSRGCTPINQPAPRWAAYVFALREMGVQIETLTEHHGGEFAGNHGRYVLRCSAEPKAEGGVK